MYHVVIPTFMVNSYLDYIMFKINIFYKQVLFIICLSVYDTINKKEEVV